MRIHSRMRGGARWLASKVRGVLSRRDDDSDFAAELDNHLELLTAEHVKRGLTRDEAGRAARLRLGGVAQLKEINRELHGWRLLETFLQDVRYAGRTMRRNPSFSAVAVATLALGIGANTAIFSVVRAVVLKPLPYAQPDQLFNVFQQRLQDETAQTGWSYQNFDALRRQNRVFSAMAGSQFHQLTLTGRGEPSVVNASVVTQELFSLLGEKPLVGRALDADDGKPGAQPVVVLSEALWRRAFGGDPAVVGSSIDLDKRSFAVVGIMPATFRFPLGGDAEQLWVPLVQEPLFGSWMPRRGGHWLRVTGRLRPGVTAADASAELRSLGARLAKDSPDENSGWTIGMIPLQQLIIGGVKPALFVLLGAVALVLLIACANLASLLLARATSRTRGDRRAHDPRRTSRTAHSPVAHGSCGARPHRGRRRNHRRVLGRGGPERASADDGAASECDPHRLRRPRVCVSSFYPGKLRLRPRTGVCRRERQRAGRLARRRPVYVRLAWTRAQCARRRRDCAGDRPSGRSGASGSQLHKAHGGAARVRSRAHSEGGDFAAAVPVLEAAPVDRLRRRAAGRCPDGAWAHERGARCAHAARRRFRESRLRHRRRPAASRWRIAAGELRVCQSRIFSSDGYPARIGSHVR